jgi:hypothetical protein
MGILMGLALIGAMATPAAAQTSELGGGWIIQKWNSNWSDAAQGFGIDFAQAIKRTEGTAISAVGDFGWARFTGEEDDTSFVGGIRFRAFRNKPVSLFVQGTTGVMHWSEDATFGNASGNNYLVGGGGGAQFRLTDMLDIKAQVDIWAAKDPDFDDWDQITRFLVGAVVKFGKK